MMDKAKELFLNWHAICITFAQMSTSMQNPNKKLKVNEGLTNSKFGSWSTQNFPLSYLTIANRSMKVSLLYPYHEESDGC
jgi:hypothetical protein